MALRCLIVDDNEPFLLVARDLLEREGVRIVGVASTSAEALQKVAELRPDVALVDIDLGGESGFDVVRQLADAGGGARSDVILISAYKENDFTDMIADSPALAFLRKSDLSAAAIREILAGAGEGDGGGQPGG